MNKKHLLTVDNLLTELSEEFNIPKPNYCLYNVVAIKKLDAVKTPSGLTVEHKRNPLSDIYGAQYTAFGRLGYIVLFQHENRAVSKNYIIHEFFHYKHHYESGKNDWLKDAEEEEKATRSETRKYLKEEK